MTFLRPSQGSPSRDHRSERVGALRWAFVLFSAPALLAVRKEGRGGRGNCEAEQKSRHLAGVVVSIERDA